MLRFVVFACVASSLALAQNIDPKDAKILKEQRFNAGDGRNGAAFATEDGQVFREETDINGNRVGQYSYIGENGQVFTVKYSAGKDGFRIIEGDHIRATGQEAAPFNPEAEQPLPAAPRAAPVQPVQAPVQAPVQQFVDYDYPVEEADPNRNPFINPHDPTHRDFAFNRNGADFEPKTGRVPTAPHAASLVPDCADCAGVNPFVNPFDASHGGLLAGHQAGFIPQQPAQPAFNVQQPTLNFRTTTPTPATRQFPPGQLKLNRFETGFNFDFESQ